KEDKGLGTTIDVIIYDGTITVGDTLILGGLQEPIVTKVRSLLEPAPLAEMRDKKSPFTPIQQAVAATGVKIVAPGLENAMAGAPLRTCKAEDVEEVKRAIQEEIKTSIITTDKKGIVIKADTLGSLEALAHLLRERNIPIRKASVGPITKKDIADAESNAEKDPLTAVILGFNLPQPRTPSNVTVITDTIIYKLIERFEEWQAKAQDAIRAKELQNVTRPCKLEILPNCIFRQSNPAIVGVEVLAGTLTSGMTLTKAGTPLATVKSMQKEKENVNSAPRGTQLAISLPGIIAGKHVGEGDILYSYLSEEEFRKLKSLVKFLTSDEKGALKEIAHIMREHNPVWGV
ncbi:translation initiation factor IF-2, partial [Candidatus Woesearchaeota archaeon]